nr:hypothetical protein GCM10020093_004160 [Planobispora longispora]
MSINLDSWRSLPAAQQPEWPDRGALEQVVTKLQGLPPLVFAGECDNLKAELAAVTRGEAFVLQGATAPRPSPGRPPTPCATS